MIVPGHHQVGGVERLRLELAQADLHRVPVLLGGDQAGPQVGVPRAEEGEQGEGAERRPQQRDGDVAEEAEVADAVDEGGVAEVLGQRQQRLAEQEDAEGAGEERHDEALVGVQPAERVDRQTVDDDRRLERHQQRGEEHDEQHVRGPGSAAWRRRRRPSTT